MNKLNSIKDTLCRKIPYLKENPEKLYLFVDDGGIFATNEPSLSYEYIYSLNIILEAFPGDQNIVFAVVVEWVKQHQPDILANPTNAPTASALRRTFSITRPRISVLT